jgi:type IV pilus assembly protein PilY1
MRKNANNWRGVACAVWLVLLAGGPTNGALASPVVPSTVPLANIDVVPSNVVLALSVEFPTGDTSSYLKSSPTYAPATTYYYGYFDPTKCYSYDASNLYFVPAGCIAGTTPKGNFLNWVSMTSLDQFRKILTGGNRIIDTASNTVLQRSYNDAQSGTGYFPTPTAKIAEAGNLGSSSTNYTYRNVNMGDKMLVQSGNSVTTTNLTNVHLATLNCADLKAMYKTKNSNNNPSWTCYHVRVQVCGSSPENNCTKYSGYKPEGLIQQYYRNMRFAAFGYLVDQVNTTQGGVLRARMKSVGPTIADALAGSIANTAPEWDATTGVFFTNPDAADATASTALSGKLISNSGVVNYLNEFGYYSTTGNAYKGYDPMAELYYEVIRYLRGLTPSPQAVSQATASNSAKFDGSPVIKFGGKGTTDDPVISSCQPNAVIAIGDVNNHCDQRVPGGSAVCSGSLPTDTVSFSAPTSQITSWEGSPVGADPGRSAGWYMGGIAYWAHINDIRPEKASGRISGQIQNVDSYFFDVLEPWQGSVQTGLTKTPFWTAAKYGGFDLTLTDQSSAATKNNPNTFKSSGSTIKSWDTNADGVPDNWFGGNDPLKMQAGLLKTFDKIASAGTTGKGGAPVASGVSLSTASKKYSASYSLANGGRGSVTSCGFTAGNCSSAPDWDTAQWLTPGASLPYIYQTYDKRKIITIGNKDFSGSSFAALGFNPATEQADTLTANRVNYLRGDSSNEIVNGGVFRSRYGTKLGDIVGAGPVYVGAPNALYNGALFPGYAKFVADHLNRKPVLYAGANDGMLHAIDADKGQELLAYIPDYFLQPNSGKNAARISALTDPTYSHQFFVDATPMVGDVIDGDWKTLLVGGYGAGGKGFYALDVTDGGASTKAKWEISDATDPDIGYTYNQPTTSPISGQSLQFALVPTSSTAAGVTASSWAIIVGNGFGSSTGAAALLLIDPAGTIKKIPIGSATDNGLATPFPVDTDNDGIIDTIWAGDLNGTLWRIRWNMASSQWVSTALFNAGSTQPITSAPAVAPHCSVAGAYNIVFGTGKYIERPDYKTTTQQSLYGILDTLGNTTVTKTDLVVQTIVSTGTPNASTGDISRTYSTNTVDFALKKGWYIDLPTANGERSVSNPLLPADTGVALLSSFVPATACLPITGYVNVLSACTGGAAIDTKTKIAIPGYGALSGRIPSFGPPISNRNQTIILTGDGQNPGYTGNSQDRLTLNKIYNSGVRASWRQIR